VGLAGNNRAGGTSMVGSIVCAHRAKHRMADSRSACQRGDAPGGAVAKARACATVTGYGASLACT